MIGGLSYCLFKTPIIKILVALSHSHSYLQVCWICKIVLCVCWTFQDKYYILVPDQLDCKTLSTRVRIVLCPCALSWVSRIASTTTAPSCLAVTQTLPVVCLRNTGELRVFGESLTNRWLCGTSNTPGCCMSLHYLQANRDSVAKLLIHIGSLLSGLV
jgi:hypothetical protein